MALYKKPSLGIKLTIFAIILSSITAFLPRFFGVATLFEWRNLTSLDDFRDTVRWYFYMPTFRSNCFFFGMLIGYVLKRNPNVYLGGKLVETIIWIISWSMSLWAFLWTEDWYVNPPSALHMILFNSVGKLVWISGWAWTVFACSTGRAG
jgi:hypothetical protein